MNYASSSSAKTAAGAKGADLRFVRCSGMRTTFAIPLVLLAACEEGHAPPAPDPRPSFAHDPANGEMRARIATGRGDAAEMRSGTGVPVVLPRGFTIYPGARIVANTVVARGEFRHILIEIETADPMAKVMLFHRAQALAAGGSLSLDLAGTEAASIGGRIATGGEFALTARRVGLVTHVQMAFGSPRQAH